MDIFDDANRLLAYTVVTNLIKKRKIKKANKFVGSVQPQPAEELPADMTFGELEDRFDTALYEIENSPEMRSSLVQVLKNLHKHNNLNNLYSADAIVEKSFDSLEGFLFDKDE